MEAMHTANYLKNRTPTKALGMKTSYEAWYGKQPDLSNLPVFGCIAFAHVPDVLRKKLDDKAVKLRFMGGKGYRLMHEDNRRITYRREVTFNELCFSFNPTVAIGSETNTVVHGKGNSELIVEPQPEPVEQAEAEVPGVVGPCRGDRQCRQPACLGINEVLVAEMEVVHSAFSETQIPEPRTMKEAMDSNKAEQWKEAPSMTHSKNVRPGLCVICRQTENQ